MTTRALLLALSLTPTLAACDKHDSDDHDDAEALESASGEQQEEVACGADNFGEARACEDGQQFCASDFGQAPRYFWGPCLAEPACTPGETPDSCHSCELDESGVPDLVELCGGDEGSTPLVLRFDEPVRFASSSAGFDLGPQCGATDWVDAATPWLALDRDGSGTIDGGHELFGSATVLRSGAVAEHGFIALAELDGDGDGRISAADPEFARLLLWADRDADRRSSGWELDPIGAAGLVAIDLTYRRDRQCDARGNCEIERASFTYRDGLGRVRTGEIVDVHLACQ